MKHLIISLIAVLTSVTVFAKIPPSPDKASTNNVKVVGNFEYSRRGSLGSYDYVVTGGTNLVSKGINSWLNDGSEDSIYGFGLLEPVGESESRITDPVSGELVQSAYFFTQNGHEFISIVKPDGCIDTYSYFGQGQKRIMTNVPFVYGLNMSSNTTARAMILPSTNDVTTTTKNLADNYLFADRDWVITILKAYQDGKLTINNDNSITIAP